MTVSSDTAAPATGSGVPTLFGLALRQFARGRRLLLLCALFSLPVILAAALRFNFPNRSADESAFLIIFTLVPHALLPLVALLYATGMIQDEIEEQTLTYLLIRPLPRWAIYVVKLVAAWLTSLALAAVFVSLTYAVLYVGRPGWVEALAARVPATLGLLAVSLLTYCAVFGFLSLFVKRALIIGIGYVVVLEFILANIDFALRRITVMYYFRVMVLHWVPLDAPAKQGWQINLSEAPSAVRSLAILLGLSAILIFLGAWIFSNREFRVKTPEAS
jgi:ABC-2 type transport system permease protein